MVILISPAKTLDFKTKNSVKQYTTPFFAKEANELADSLKKLTIEEIINLMGISYDLANTNYQRFQFWEKQPNRKIQKEALFAFKGEVYRGIDIESWQEEKKYNSQRYLRILSGIYGLLRPFDIINPYRLEMGTMFSTNGKKDLYEFWGHKITTRLNDEVKELGAKYIINLASKEYFKAVKTKNLIVPVIEPVFKNEKNGKYKTIAVYAKKARGLMTRYIIDNNLKNVEELKLFNADGYAYSHEMSKSNQWVFIR